MTSGKRIVVVGGTSAMAEHCARIWVKKNAAEIVLVGRNVDKLNAVADDLRLRGTQTFIQVRTADFMNPSEIQGLMDELFAKPVDIVLIAHGDLPDQKLCQSNLQLVMQAQMVNGISPILFAEAAAGLMERVNHGTLAVIGSVAGDRGRKSNYVYGAAKGLVTRYMQGLQHRLAKTAVKVVLIKPGPTATPMTANLEVNGPQLASVQSVAGVIVNGVERGAPVVYAPKKWSAIMMVIRHLPRFIFRELDI